MERKVGEQFRFRGKMIEVKAASTEDNPLLRCGKCVLNNVWCSYSRYEKKFGLCFGNTRDDSTDVYFEQL